MIINEILNWVTYSFFLDAVAMGAALIFLLIIFRLFLWNPRQDRRR